MFYQSELFQRGTVLQLPYINTNIRQNEWLRYGNNNLFPDHLATLSSTTHDAIVRRKILFAMGNGIKSSDPFIQKFLNNTAVGITFNELTRRLIHDYVLFGGLSILNLFSNRGLVVKLQHIAFQSVRAAFPEWLEITDFYISNNWAKYTMAKDRPSEKIPIFGSDSGTGRELLYAYQYDLGGNLKYYPVPTWFSAQNDIYAENQMAVNRVNYIENNFTGNVVFMMPKKINSKNQNGEPEIENDLLRKIGIHYTGAENAGKPIIVFGEPNANGETQMPQIHELGSKNRVDEYNEQQKIVEANIAKAHGVTSPVLLGISGNAALGNNASEIETAMVMFFNTEIKPVQAYIIEQLERILAYNNGLNSFDYFPSGTLYFDNPSILAGLEKK